eukprot:81491_1
MSDEKNSNQNVVLEDIAYKELDQLILQLDNLFNQHPQNSDSQKRNKEWHENVANKDQIANKIFVELSKIPQSIDFKALNYLLSNSKASRIVGIRRIEYDQNPTNISLLGYMLLNEPQAFHQYYILLALQSTLTQCNLEQSETVQNVLKQYKVKQNTSRYALRNAMMSILNVSCNFSVDCINPHNHKWWKFVESKFFNSMFGRQLFRIKSIQLIRNKKLSNNFDTLKKTYHQNNINDEIYYVYHGSSLSCLKSIAKNGFFEPKQLQIMNESQRNKNNIQVLDAGYFGKGIYQGFAADYAILYSHKYKKSNVILMSKVLPGNMYQVEKGGDQYGKACNTGYQSHISPEQNELVLFKSAQVLPMFMICFKSVASKTVVEEQI